MASEALKVNASVQKIDLERNSIGDEGAKALAEVHRRCPCKCSLERVNGSSYAFIAILLACMMDRRSVSKLYARIHVRSAFCQQHLTLFLKSALNIKSMV